MEYAFNFNLDAVFTTLLAVNERFPERRMAEGNLAMNMASVNTVFSLTVMRLFGYAAPTRKLSRRIRSTTVVINV